MRILTVILLSAISLTSFGVEVGTSPKALGYSFPEEWGKHKATMMIFPAKRNYGRETKHLRAEFVNIANAIAANEPVEIYCLESEKSECQQHFYASKNITIHSGKFGIDWSRDNAPIVLKNKKGAFATAGFQSNGWGKKYRGWQYDTDTRKNIAMAKKWKIFHSDLVLEGGAIEIADGIGIVTESSVLNPNRTNWPKQKVEEELKKMFGLKKIIWIKSGLMSDPHTDGHIDGLLKFISKDTVLLHTTDLRSDPNYKICKEAKRTLRANGIKVKELPLQDDIVHMNFYIGSGGKVAYVPICGDPAQDDPALKIIRRHFKKVVPIVANHLFKAGGGIHCHTMQIPE